MEPHSVASRLPALRGGQLAQRVGWLLAILAGDSLRWMVPHGGEVLFQCVLTGFVALALRATLVRMRSTEEERRGWACMAAGLGLALSAQTLRIPLLLAANLPESVQRLPFVFQVVGAIIQIAGLFSWPLLPRRAAQRGRFLLDGLVMAGSVFLILWGLALGPLFHGEALPFRDLLQLFIYFLVYDLLLGLAFTLGMPRPGRFLGPLGWLGAGYAFACTANLVWAVHVHGGGSALEHPLGALVLAIPACFHQAACSRRPLADSEESRHAGWMAVLLLHLPLLAALVLGAFFILAGTVPDRILVGLSFLVLLGLVIRQFLAILDLQAARRNLEAKVEQRTQSLQEAQQVLLRTERLNSFSLMGAGMVHDINNLLCAIRGYTTLTRQDLGADRTVLDQDMAKLEEATDAAAGLAGRLRAFARQEDAAPALLCLPEILAGMEPLLRVVLPKRIELEFHHPEPRLQVVATPGQLEQVMVNLVGNARDALAGPGRIQVRTRVEDSWAVLEVEDDGPGIPTEIRDRIFQPFASTKARGYGSGIGLASVKIIVESLGGTIRVEQGRGARFVLRFPRVDAGT